MGMVSPGFTGRRRGGDELPPGQYLTQDFPVLSAGPTPHIQPEHWEFTVANEAGEVTRWDWKSLTSLPSEKITKDLHCVTRWSKLGTAWKGVSLDVVLGDIETGADFVMVHSYGGYTTNLPLEDLLDGQLDGRTGPGRGDRVRPGGAIPVRRGQPDVQVLPGQVPRPVRYVEHDGPGGRRLLPHLGDGADLPGQSPAYRCSFHGSPYSW